MYSTTKTTSIILLQILICGTLSGQGFKFDYNTPIKNVEGNFISLKKFDRLIDSDKWLIKVNLKKTKELDYLQLILKTSADINYEKKLKQDYIDFEEKINLKGKPLGKIAPDFEATDTNGNQYSLKNLKGKIIFIYYPEISIKFSKDQLKKVNVLYKKYETNPNIKFLMTTSVNKKQLSLFLKNNSFSFPFILNPHIAFKEYPEIYPNYILINEKGEFEYIISNMNLGQLEKDIDKLLKKI